MNQHNPHLRSRRTRLSERRRILSSLVASRTGIFGLVVVLIVALTAVFAPYLAPYDPNDQIITKTSSPPEWKLEKPAYFLGADHLGRDLLSRIIYGSRVSLIIGLSAVGLAGTIGSFLGLIAGFYGGRVDSLIMRLADLQLSIPFLILAIAVLGVLGPGLRNLVIVLGIAGWVTYGRVVRGEVLSVRERDYVLAARVLGTKKLQIAFRHVLPNVLPSVIVIASLEVARMIISEAALSFLGLGVQPPTPSWGSMVADGRNYIATAWWISTFPGIAIVITVLSINLLGDWLRDALDPRLRER